MFVGDDVDVVVVVAHRGAELVRDPSPGSG
jgi:hypothetical protein